eukprot:766791-Hanusia_phi.AAC.2
MNRLSLLLAGTGSLSTLPRQLTAPRHGEGVSDLTTAMAQPDSNHIQKGEGMHCVMAIGKTEEGRKYIPSPELQGGLSTYARKQGDEIGPGEEEALLQGDVPIQFTRAQEKEGF